MVRSAAVLLCATAVLAAGAPLAADASSLTAKTTDYLNLRQGAGTNTSVILTLSKNVSVTILDNSNGQWAKVKTASGRVGYCFKQYLSYSGSGSGSASGASQTAVTTVSLNMRTGPSLQNGILAVLAPRTSLKVIDNSNAQWVKVQMPNGRQGWCYRSYLKISGSSGAAQPAAPAASGTTATTTDYLHLRSGAGLGYGIVLTLSKGATATVLDNSNANWVKILTASGKQGWCSRQYLKISGKPSESSQNNTGSQSGGTAGNSSAVTGATVTADVLRLRATAGTSGKILDRLPNGTSLKVLSTSTPGWVKVQTPAGKVGYVSADYVKLLSSGSQSGGSGSQNGGTTGNSSAVTGATVTADILRLRATAGTSGKILDRLPNGASLKVLSTSTPGWVKVQTSAGKVGYVSAEYVKLLYGGNTGSQGTSVSLSASSASVPQGKTLWLKASASPSGASVTWTSSNPAVAKVTNGYVYAVAPGTAQIKASAGAGSASCGVAVTAAEPVRVTYASPNIAAPGKAVTFTAVTDSARDGAEFVVTMPNGGTKTLRAGSCRQETTNGVVTKVWTASASFSSPGLYSYQAYSSQHGAFSSRGVSSSVLVSTQGNEAVTTGETRRASDKMLQLIAGWEGYSAAVYADQLASSRIPTIGYGCTLGTNAVFYNNVSETEAWAMMVDKVNNGSYTTELNRMIANNHFLMNQGQADCLISFAYNVGAGYFNSSAEMDFRRIMKNAVVPPKISSGSSLAATVTYDTSLRSNHTLLSNSIRSVPSGTSVRVTGTYFANKQDGWYQVRLSNGATGWINSGYVNLSNSGSLVHDLNYTNAYAFGTELILWNQAGGQFYTGLFYRRLGEANVYNYRDYSKARYNKYGYTYPSSAKNLN
ncbi:MAG: SH3 domain-containing protein [Oscillospiraceae bacterium]|jgi:uncharacterized protein YgiM (DUF1202 family)|nr:SH3 domain-containing protein [Oscillospiraceae bacterium]MCI1990871.1 SH3 domain-containing protein [Oscillospiraceae bacterium]MCI2036050.1 SH3 domain-containing protein [Oscillospiraceae bacterium]